MNRTKRACFNFFLSVLTFVFVVSLSTAPTLGKETALQPQIPQWAQGTGLESILAGKTTDPSMKRYSVNLSSRNIVPNAPSTTARGMAEATLMGDRLMVSGRFNGLSSGLRDYAADPTDPPNAKITSAVHIHRGEATQNGPFQFALTVMTDNMGMGGQFSGEYKLSNEQLQALAEGKLYIDLHTQQNRAGELRGYLQPA